MFLQGKTDEVCPQRLSPKASTQQAIGCGSLSLLTHNGEDEEIVSSHMKVWDFQLYTKNKYVEINISI